MAVAEYDEGFLLAEVPLGEGFLDLPKMIALLREARPDIRFNLEMITRDPLRIPCLTDQYWATSANVPGRVSPALWRWSADTSDATADQRSKPKRATCGGGGERAQKPGVPANCWGYSMSGNRRRITDAP